MNKELLLNEILNIARGITILKDGYIKDEELTLDFVTIFSHSEPEFKDLSMIAKTYGDQVDEHNGPVFKFHTPLNLDKDSLKIFRIRKPTEDRPQIGCGDFMVPDYETFKKRYLDQKNFGLFQGEGFEYIGIIEPGSDYLVYFPSQTETEYLESQGKI